MLAYSTPSLTLVLAIAQNGALGLRGKLPWHLPEDLAFFKRVTWGHAIIMGRRTWDETGAALPGRRNIVVSRDRSLALPGAEVVSSIEAAIALARATDPDPCVIGGAEMYRMALPYATRIILTEIALSPEADTFFTFDRGLFNEVERRPGVDPRLTFVTLERKKLGPD